MDHGDKHPNLHLTAREVEVLRLIADGRSSKQIAAGLHIAPKTVESYVEHTRLKLGATNRAHLIALAAAEGLLTDDR